MQQEINEALAAGVSFKEIMFVVLLLVILVVLFIGLGFIFSLLFKGMEKIVKKFKK